MPIKGLIQLEEKMNLSYKVPKILYCNKSITSLTRLTSSEFKLTMMATFVYPSLRHEKKPSPGTSKEYPEKGIQRLPCLQILTLIILYHQIMFRLILLSQKSIGELMIKTAKILSMESIKI